MGEKGREVTKAVKKALEEAEVTREKVESVAKDAMKGAIECKTMFGRNSTKF